MVLSVIRFVHQKASPLVFGNLSFWELHHRGKRLGDKKGFGMSVKFIINSLI
jgi:hypothetical protein